LGRHHADDAAASAAEAPAAAAAAAAGAEVVSAEVDIFEVVSKWISCFRWC